MEPAEFLLIGIAARLTSSRHSSFSSVCIDPPRPEREEALRKLVARATASRERFHQRPLPGRMSSIAWPEEARSEASKARAMEIQKNVVRRSCNVKQINIAESYVEQQNNIQKRSACLNFDYQEAKRINRLA